MSRNAFSGRSAWRAGLFPLVLGAAAGCTNDASGTEQPAGAGGGVTATVGVSSSGGAGAGGDTTSGGGASGGAGGEDNTAAPSCESAAPGAGMDCGADGHQACCDTIAVPGGTFLRSYDGLAYTNDAFAATVSPFLLDRYEITVGRFRAFVEAGGGTRLAPPTPGSGNHPTLSGSGWSAAFDALLPLDEAALRNTLDCGNAATWTNAPAEHESRPMTCLSWAEAMAFCIWDGGRLPTEAEWNFAAAGGDQQRAYPWSDPPMSTVVDATHAVYDAGDAGAAAVGSRSPLGDGRWGHADLAGNVWEWTLDLAGPFPSPCEDCANLGAGDERRRRGGSFFSGPELILVGVRGDDAPGVHATFIGARCARDPEEPRAGS